MPKLSRWTPCGMLRFSSKPSLAETIEKSIARAQGGNFSEEDESLMAAKRYATAMAIARAGLTLERAGNQAEPTKAYEMLPVLEGMYGITPGREATLPARRALLAARYKLSNGSRRENFETQLRAELGDDFVAYRTTTSAEAAQVPATPASGPGTFKAPTTRYKVIRFTQSIATGLGAPQWVTFESVSGDTAPPRANETIVVDPGRLGQQEKVTVLAVNSGFTEVQLTLTRPHEAGTLATFYGFPFWGSTKKHSLIVVKNGKTTPENRRKVNEIMGRIATGTSTWDLVEENSVAGSTGPTKVGEASLGMKPIGTISY